MDFNGESLRYCVTIAKLGREQSALLQGTRYLVWSPSVLSSSFSLACESKGEESSLAMRFGRLCWCRYRASTPVQRPDGPSQDVSLLFRASGRARSDPRPGLEARDVRFRTLYATE